MSQQRSIEVSAADIEAAIDKGIAELGVSRQEVMVEVLEEPSRRLLGLGARQAKVRLTVIRAPATPPAEVKTEPKTEPRVEVKAPVREQPAAPKPSRQPEPAEDQESDYDMGGTEEYVDPYADAEVLPGGRTAVSAVELAEDARIGATVLQTLLDKMQIDAMVASQKAETDDREPQHWTLEIQGRNLGALIGKRGETLAALQYVTRLIASRELGRRANIVIDVEGYKSRREVMLKRLAKRMAEQALQRGRTVTLEPMPPHERRIIHLTLRDDPNVKTESVGEGERRKVTIIPRRQK